VTDRRSALRAAERLVRLGARLRDVVALQARVEVRHAAGQLVGAMKEPTRRRHAGTASALVPEDGRHLYSHVRPSARDTLRRLEMVDGAHLEDALHDILHAPRRAPRRMSPRSARAAARAASAAPPCALPRACHERHCVRAQVAHARCAGDVIDTVGMPAAFITSVVGAPGAPGARPRSGPLMEPSAWTSAAGVAPGSPARGGLARVAAISASASALAFIGGTSCCGGCAVAALRSAADAFGPGVALDSAARASPAAAFAFAAGGFATTGASATAAGGFATTGASATFGTPC
jgi:hypothetical protein